MPASGFLDSILMMPGVPEILREIFIALAIGGLIGLERENTPERKYAGLRTLTILCGIGPAIVFLSETIGNNFFVYIYMFMAFALSIINIVLRMNLKEGKMGLTTSVAVFLVGVLGVLVGYNMYLEAISIAIITAFLLAEKESLQKYVDKLSKQEISDALKLSMLVFILLPVLPTSPVGPFGSINLREILLLVVFVLLIEFTAYILMRQVGPSKGIPITGFLGGGASSFATAGVMARIANKDENLLNPASSGVFLSTVAMIMRNISIAVVLFVGHAGLTSFFELKNIFLPSGLMVSLALVFAYFTKDGKTHEELDIPITSPFSFKSAFKFALIFILIAVISTVSKMFFGNAGLYFTSIIGGFASSAAVVTTAMSMVNNGSIGIQVASGMVVLSIVSSIVSKMMVVGVLNRNMRSKVILPMFLNSVLGLAVFFLF